MSASKNGISIFGIRIEPLYWVLLALPVAIVLELTHAPALWIFVASCVAIIPLAGLMGRATESLAETMGPNIGGLLNATFGNAAELIIALFALYRGKVELVKASITGSILGNVLLVMGAAFLMGGFYHKRQTFNRTAASLGATQLALASIGLIVPALYYLFTTMHPSAATRANLVYLSEEIAIILAFMYLLSLVFSLRTHQHLFAGPEAEVQQVEEQHELQWGRGFSLTVLLVATGLIALMSEFLVGSIEPAGKALGMSELFIGVIVVAVIGNAAEHSTAVLVAMKNKMDLAVTISIGSGLQIALFVAPLLVFAGLAMGQPMDLHFTLMEVIAVVIAIAVVSLVCQDGESHWMEGALLLAVYVILGLAFYYYPEELVTAAARE